MSEEFDDILDNLREPTAWIRIIFMLAFALVLYVVFAPVILVLMTAQALFSIITGDSNSNLKSLNSALNKYVFQILQFISYNSELKPFPFSDFPEVDSDAAADGESAEAESDQAQTEESGATSVKKSAQRKKPAARKKTTAKKKAASKKASKASDVESNGSAAD